MLKLDSFEAENFKNITHKQVDVAGRSFVIIGKNEQGKSSLIDAILSSIDNKVIPSEPRKKGEKDAKTSIRISGDILGEEKEYTISMYFSDKDQRGKLVIQNEAGEVIRTAPRAFLDGLIGKVGFDVMTFLRGSRKEDVERRIKELKKLTGKEKEIYMLEVEKKSIISKREEQSGVIRSLEAIVYQHGITDEEFEKCQKPVDAAVIEKELEDVQPTLKKISDFKERFSKLLNDTSQLESTVVSLSGDSGRDQEKINELIAEIEKLKTRIAARAINIDNAKANIVVNKENITKGELWLSKNVAPDINDISLRLKDANKHNQVYEKIQEFKTKQKDLFAKKAEYEKTNDSVKKIDSKIKTIIANSNLPVKGLGFDDDGIYLDGLPLEVGQINTAKILEVGEEIAMAMNPNLRLLIIRDASLYDKDNLSRLVKKAHDRGYQVVAEIVGTNEDVEIKFMEEYLK